MIQTAYSVEVGLDQMRGMKEAGGRDMACRVALAMSAMGLKEGSELKKTVAKAEGAHNGTGKATSQAVGEAASHTGE